ncbi:MAG: CapA family protein [Thermoplasmatota archaeon]
MKKQYLSKDEVQMVREILPVLLTILLSISGTVVGGGSAGGGEGDLTIVLMGDIVFNGNLGRLAETQGDEYPFEEVLPHIEDADIILANLEGPISDRGTPEENKYSTFRMDPRSIRSLEYAGIDAVSLSNNHCLDYGPDALNDTLIYLDEAGIGHAGIFYGEDIGNATIERPVIITSGGITLGFLAYTEDVRGHWKADADFPGPLPLDRDLMEDDIRTSSNLVDILVVSIHWRKWPQYTEGPEPSDIELCHDVVDWGADIVMGHGPHTVHEVEGYGDSLVLYSLGNAQMDTGNDTSDLSYIARVRIVEGNIEGLELVPTYKKSYRYIPMGTPVERNPVTGLNVSREEVMMMYEDDIYGRVDDEWSRNDPRMLFATAPWYLRVLLVLLLISVAAALFVLVLTIRKRTSSGRER